LYIDVNEVAIETIEKVVNLKMKFADISTWLWQSTSLLAGVMTFFL